MLKWFKPEHLLLLCFLLVPFGFLVSGPVNAKIPYIHIGQHYAFILSALVVVAVLIKNKFITSFLIWSVLWMVFIFIYKIINYAFVPVQVVTNALDTIIYFLAGATVFYAVSKSRIKNKTFYNIICIAAILQAGLALMQKMGFDPVLWVLNQFILARPLLDPTILTGTLGNNNFLAAYVAITLPFFFREKWRYFLPVMAVVLYLSNTTSAVIPAIIGAMFFFWPEIQGWKKHSCVVAGVLAAIWYALFQHSNVFLNPRWQDWDFALKQLYIYNPVYVLVGMGPGAGWGKSYPMHNEWLQCMHQYGLIGFSLLAGYVATIYRGNRILFTAFLIAAINIFGNYSLHLAPSAFLIILIAGLIERERGKIND